MATTLYGYGPHTIAADGDYDVACVGGREGRQKILTIGLDRTGGTMRLWPAMLYRNLQKLEEEHLIEETDGPAAPMAGSPRFFHLTASGRRACTAEARRLSSFVDAAREKNLLKKGRP